MVSKRKVLSFSSCSGGKKERLVLRRWKTACLTAAFWLENILKIQKDKSFRYRELLIVRMLLLNVGFRCTYSNPALVGG